MNMASAMRIRKSLFLYPLALTLVEILCLVVQWLKKKLTFSRFINNAITSHNYMSNLKGNCSLLIAVDAVDVEIACRFSGGHFRST